MVYMEPTATLTASTGECPRCATNLERVLNRSAKTGRPHVFPEEWTCAGHLLAWEAATAKAIKSAAWKAEQARRAEEPPLTIDELWGTLGVRNPLAGKV